MMFKKNVGVVGYGTYIPSIRIQSAEIEHKQHKTGQNTGAFLGIVSKSSAFHDEDSITMTVEAGLDCFSRFPLLKNKKKEIGALFIGSESHPYTVKPSGTVVASALGLPKTLSMTDLQFACKAGMQAVLLASTQVLSDSCELGVGVGSDTATSKEGDVLEYSSAAGSAFFVLGKERIIANILGTVSLASDTPDFWRKPGYTHPNHTGRFTGTPGYFNHVSTAVSLLLHEAHLSPNRISYCVFHTPNAKFPKLSAKAMGFTNDQLKHSLIVEHIGNTYAAAVLLALANTLDHAKKGDLILAVSYGSGAGADAVLFRMIKNGKKHV